MGRLWPGEAEPTLFFQKGLFDSRVAVTSPWFLTRPSAQDVQRRAQSQRGSPSIPVEHEDFVAKFDALTADVDRRHALDLLSEFPVHRWRRLLAGNQLAHLVPALSTERTARR